MNKFNKILAEIINSADGTIWNKYALLAIIEQLRPYVELAELTIDLWNKEILSVECKYGNMQFFNQFVELIKEAENDKL